LYSCHSFPTRRSSDLVFFLPAHPGHAHHLRPARRIGGRALVLGAHARALVPKLDHSAAVSALDTGLDAPADPDEQADPAARAFLDRKSTRLNSSHQII